MCIQEQKLDVHGMQPVAKFSSLQITCQLIYITSSHKVIKFLPIQEELVVKNNWRFRIMTYHSVSMGIYDDSITT